jgi:diguanylate cyclase (GGDEF)-like protein
MDKIKIRGTNIFRALLYTASLIIFIDSALSMNIKSNSDAILFSVFLIGCLLIGMMTINVGKGYIELSDAIMAFILITFGRSVVVIFAAAYWSITFVINERGKCRKERESIIFNAAMFIVGVYLTAAAIDTFIPLHMRNSVFGIIVLCTCFVFIFLLINVFIFVLDYSLITGKIFLLTRESIEMLPINFVVSAMLTITTCIVRNSSGLAGSILVLGILIILHYSFFIYGKLNKKNESIKGLLKITSDIVKYGDFRDQCKYLILNLKELIPYTICAIYTFDIDADSTSFPVAFNCPEGIDIGEFKFEMSSSDEIVNIIKDGKIYISNDVLEDPKIKLGEKILDIIDTAILVPVVVSDKTSGLILIGGDRNLEDFMENGADDILNILSNQMSLAIENDGIYRNIKSKADIDPLTKLYNRRAFDREIEDLIAANTTFSMVMYDIDDFKRVNDSYGHLVGDEVLKAISEDIKKSIRKTDVPCRYGGEEIVIIFKDLEKEDALIISERIRKKIETTSVVFGNKNVCVTVSGGVSSFPEDGSTKEDIINNADNVLYSECKSKGKNRVFAYKLSEGKVLSFDHSSCTV